MQEGKGKFSLKITLDPFTEKDVKVAVDHGAVRVTGSRGETTGVRIDDSCFKLLDNFNDGYLIHFNVEGIKEKFYYLHILFSNMKSMKIFFLNEHNINDCNKGIWNK